MFSLVEPDMHSFLVACELLCRRVLPGCSWAEPAACAYSPLPLLSLFTVIGQPCRCLDGFVLPAVPGYKLYARQTCVAVNMPCAGLNFLFVVNVRAFIAIFHRHCKPDSIRSTLLAAGRQPLCPSRWKNIDPLTILVDITSLAPYENTFPASTPCLLAELAVPSDLKLLTCACTAC